MVLGILFSRGVSRLSFTHFGCFSSRGSRLCQSFVWHLDSIIFICWDDTSASRTSIVRAIAGGTAIGRASTNWCFTDRASTSGKLTGGSIGGHEVGRTSTGGVSSCEAWAGRIEMAVVWVGVIGLPASSDIFTKSRVTAAGLGVCVGGAATLWGQSCSWQGYDRTWSGWSSSWWGWDRIWWNWISSWRGWHGSWWRWSSGMQGSERSWRTDNSSWRGELVAGSTGVAAGAACCNWSSESNLGWSNGCAPEPIPVISTVASLSYATANSPATSNCHTLTTLGHHELLHLPFIIFNQSWQKYNGPTDSG